MIRPNFSETTERQAMPEALSASQLLGANAPQMSSSGDYRHNSLRFNVGYRRSETILVVEDEETVRNVASLILQTYGYTVLKADCAKTALQTCQTYQGAIHLMLTDVVMPDLSGAKLADIARQLLPGMKVLYMSGYLDDVILKHGLTNTNVDFLAKPFTPHALAMKVLEILDGCLATGSVN